MRNKTFFTTIAISLVLTIFFSIQSPALAKPKPEPIGKLDFTLTIGKTKVNLLTGTCAQIKKAAGMNYVKIKDIWGDFNIGLKTKEAIFMPVEKTDKYMSAALLTKYGATARGIKIGSKKADVLKAYPDPYYKYDLGNDYVYRFVATDAPVDDFNFDKLEKERGKRPAWYYEIWIQIDNKTQKVNQIAFCEYTPWA